MGGLGGVHMWLLELLFLLVIFVVVFFVLIRLDRGRFSGLLRVAQVFLGAIMLGLLALLLDSRLGFLTLFYLFFGAASGMSYFLFLKHSKKVGFIGLAFCLVFVGIFLYLHFVLLNFDF